MDYILSIMSNQLWLSSLKNSDPLSPSCQWPQATLQKNINLKFNKNITEWSGIKAGIKLDQN